MVREVRVGVARVGVEEATVATTGRVHPRPGVVAERDDAGGGLDLVGEGADAVDVVGVRSRAAPGTIARGGG